jgi:hypothetical protein
VGIVEVGGASTQVTFAVASTSDLGTAVKRISIDSQHYDVLSVSYLGLGQNEVRQTMVEAVAADHFAQNHCFPIERFRSITRFDASRLILLASFYYKMHDWELLGDKRPDHSLLNEAFSRCAGTDAWLRLSRQQGTGFYLQNACANATYLYTLIFSRQGLALAASRIETLTEINEQPVSWTRSYALLKVGP